MSAPPTEPVCAFCGAGPDGRRRFFSGRPLARRGGGETPFVCSNCVRSFAAGRAARTAPDAVPPCPLLARAPALPPRIAELYGDWSWSVAWQIVAEAIVYRLEDDSGELRFLKVADAGREPGPLGEAARARWAAPHLPVPEVLDSGTDAGSDWLLTRGLPGVDATDPSLTADPAALVEILAAGLRRVHEAPVDGCPFDFRLDAALGLARRRLEAGLIDAERDFHEEHAHLDAEEAVRLLEERRPGSEELVLCHGDYCLPNALVEEGRVTGFVDLGELAVADRWWDLAVASWSVTWNLGPGLEGAFLEAYGVTPDTERIAFYRLLYDVVS